MMEQWLAAAVKAGLSFEEAEAKISVVLDDADYYAERGFAGLISLVESERPDNRTDREKWADVVLVNTKRF